MTRRAKRAHVLPTWSAASLAEPWGKPRLPFTLSQVRERMLPLQGGGWGAQDREGVPVRDGGGVAVGDGSG